MLRTAAETKSTPFKFCIKIIYISVKRRGRGLLLKLFVARTIYDLKVVESQLHVFFFFVVFRVNFLSSRKYKYSGIE